MSRAQAGYLSVLFVLVTRVTSPKGAKTRIFLILSAFFPYTWPLAGPNIARKGGPLQKLARGDRQTHFGTFNFWAKPLFARFGYLFLDFGTSSPGSQPLLTHF